jgi:hypothetical protein
MNQWRSHNHNPIPHQLSYSTMPTRRWIATRCQRLKHWGEQHRFDRFVIRTHRFLTIKPSIDSINTGSYLTTYSRDRDTPLCWLEDQEPKIERTSRCGGVDPPRPLIEPETADHLKITSFLRRAILIEQHKTKQTYRVCPSCSVTVNQRCAVCCSSWNSTVKARQAVVNDLAIQLVKRGHRRDLPQHVMDIDRYVCKMKLQQRHLTWWILERYRTLLASSLDILAIECIKTSRGCDIYFYNINVL